MDLESIIKLINAVSDSSVSSFTLEEGNMKISLEKNKGELPVSEISGTQVPHQSAVPVLTPVCEEEGSYVTSPLVGTYYNSSSPDSEPFVKAGEAVKKGQTLGIIEAMKLMNEIECEFDGIVEEVLVANEQMVEYGQHLFRIKCS